MKHCGQLIENILEERRIKKKDFAAGIGIMPQNVAKLLHEPTIDIRRLEDVCRFLGLSPLYFFDYCPTSDTSHGTVGADIKQSVGIGLAEVNLSDHKLIDKLLASYDARIAGYEAQIRSLENTVSVLRTLLAGKVDSIG